MRSRDKKFEYGENGPRSECLIGVEQPNGLGVSKLATLAKGKRHGSQ